MPPTPSKETSELLIHELLHSVQESLRIAEENSQGKHSFSVSELEVTASFNFALKEDEVLTPSQRKGGSSSGWLSLFHRNPPSVQQGPENDDEQVAGKVTVRMVFRPGAHRLELVDSGSLTPTEGRGL